MIQKTSNVKVIYLSGNHDIGYEAFNSQKPEVHQMLLVRCLLLAVGLLNIVCIIYLLICVTRLSNAMRENLVLGTLKLHLDKWTSLPLTHRLWMVIVNDSTNVQYSEGRRE